MKTEKQAYYAEYYKKNKDKHIDNMKRYKKENADDFQQYQQTYHKKKYYNNKENIDVELLREQWREQSIIKNKQRRAFIDEYKSKCSCGKCGDIRPYVLDFHHLDPSTKSFNLGDASTKGIKAIEEELKKCITLCRNCHSEFHYLEKKDGITLNVYLL
jgi:Zn finger protein HypA/HybF involved in hydrogenase expression